MTTRLSREEFLRNLRDSGLFSTEEWAKSLPDPTEYPVGDGEALARRLIVAGTLTAFQAAAVRERRFEELVIGNYQVLDRLGAGGMGTVYKARHRRMKRLVAIKVLSRSAGQSDQFVQRFQREVEAVARLSHPNIVLAHDADDADEAEVGHFLVMEFVNGRDLATEVQQRVRTQQGIVRKYLQEIGFSEIATATSGEKAIEIARNARPGVVISAMHLADMTGMQLAQQMRAEESLSSTGFVLISSQADADEVQSLSPSRSMVRLAKPFGVDQLAHVLASVVDDRPRPATDVRDRLRVLVVDDSTAARMHVRGVLAGLGSYEFAEAADGAEAVALLEKQSFDLVVTDYNMPHLDGRGLIEFIRHRSSNPSLPVIVITTETDPAKLNALQRLGVSAVCDKSFKPEVVEAVMERLG